MCYPKPGPRCSAHAALRLAKARRDCMAFLHNPDKSRHVEYDEWEKHKKALDKAEAEYDITPAGIKAIERLLKENPDSEYYKEKLEQFTGLRAAKLAAIKTVDPKEVSHRINSAANFQYANNELSEDGRHLHVMDHHDPEIAVALEESAVWSAKLTDEEIETVKWYTQAGYTDVNGPLADPNYIGHAYNPEVSRRATEVLDSALSKVDFDRDVVVYRRHSLFEPGGKTFAHPTLEDQQKIFPVGSEYAPGFFMSTSLDPANAPTTNDNIVFFEIKTRRAASLSAIAQSGSYEREFLLPRDSRYRVVDNSRKVTIGSSRHKQDRTLTVIQLEEI